MQKIDPAAILGFSVNAAERPNAGEIQSVHDAHWHLPLPCDELDTISSQNFKKYINN